ncbi:AlpA family phage regulatory protein [Vibrio parahaemolyticus]|nr:AlpA family phage regulatory protein [Vibrio parahaemolyticus]MCF9546948.1 AlpA family phage regulatory protein [Vibrio parahaemolyticus]
MAQSKYPQNQKFDRVLSADEVSYIIGKSKKTIWRLWRKQNAFPKPILIAGRCCGWRESTINKFLETGEVL